ncbi:MAG: hypothetical protein Q9226_007702 [Calogaya cf. arnoldii]
MHVLDSKGEVWKTFIVMIPTLGAALVAVSRIMDARHHPFDVISGSMLGMLVAWGAYRQYFPPVTETWRKGRAYPIRTWGAEPKPPASADHTLLRDEEFKAPPQPVRSRSQTWNAPAAGGASGGNVFREQISKSQRQRRHDLGEPTEQSSSSSVDLEARHPRRPLPGARPQMQRVPSNIYPPSSSDDEAGEDGFEMQPRPSASAGGIRAEHTAVDAFGQDVSYHPPIRNLPNLTGPSGETGAQTRGSLSPGMVRAPRSEADGSSLEEQRPRGVDLVETYR